MIAAIDVATQLPLRNSQRVMADADKDAEFRRRWREINSDPTLSEKDKANRLQELQRLRFAPPSAAASPHAGRGTWRRHEQRDMVTERTRAVSVAAYALPPTAPRAGRASAPVVSAAQAILDETLKCTICQNTCDKPVTVRPCGGGSLTSTLAL